MRARKARHARYAAKLQPGEWLVHTNDVQEVLDKLQDRIYEAMGWGGERG